VKSYRIPFNQLVSILADQKERLQEDKLASPFDNADDRKLSEAAGEYLKLYIQRLQRYRHGLRDDPFKKMLSIVGYNLRKMKLSEYEDLLADFDDFELRLNQFADYLLSSFGNRLSWCETTINVDNDAEEIVLAIGQDYRISQYYVLTKEIANLARIPVVRMPRVIEEIDDLADVENTVFEFVDGIFRQVEDSAVRDELKKKLIDYIAAKN
jgi:hypothetical protein